MVCWPWCEQRGMPVMAYSPLGNNSLVRDPTLARIGAAHGCSATAIALAWAIRSGHVIAIPESGSAGAVEGEAPRASRRSRYRHPRIWLGGACKGERRRVLTDAHAAGTSDIGCSASAAQPLERAENTPGAIL